MKSLESCAHKSNPSSSIVIEGAKTKLFFNCVLREREKLERSEKNLCIKL